MFWSLFANNKENPTEPLAYELLQKHVMSFFLNKDTPHITLSDQSKIIKAIQNAMAKTSTTEKLSYDHQILRDIQNILITNGISFELSLRIIHEIMKQMDASKITTGYTQETWNLLHSQWLDRITHPWVQWLMYRLLLTASNKDEKALEKVLLRTKFPLATDWFISTYMSYQEKNDTVAVAMLENMCFALNPLWELELQFPAHHFAATVFTHHYQMTYNDLLNFEIPTEYNLGLGNQKQRQVLVSCFPGATIQEKTQNFKTITSMPNGVEDYRIQGFAKTKANFNITGTADASWVKVQPFEVIAGRSEKRFSALKFFRKLD